MQYLLTAFWVCRMQYLLTALWVGRMQYLLTALWVCRMQYLLTALLGLQNAVPAYCPFRFARLYRSDLCILR